MNGLLDNGLKRRDFLLGTIHGGSALVVGLTIPAATRVSAETADNESGLKPNAWLSIDEQGHTTIICDKSEIGQGISDGFVSVVAEELGASLNRVSLGEMPTDPSNWIGRMSVAGSRSMRSAWQPLRVAGAQARELLIKVAAQRLNASESEFYTQDSAVIHRASDVRIDFSELVANASRLQPSESPQLKPVSEYTIVGKQDARESIEKKITGKAKFGLDAEMEGQLFASIERSPKIGATVKSVEDTRALAIPGVERVVVVEPNSRAGVRSGVAVLATNYYAAQRGRSALDIDWDFGSNEMLSSETLADELKRIAKQPVDPSESVGDFESAYESAVRQIEIEYDVPYLHHMPMEPMNCTADVRADSCAVWAPTQAQGSAQNAAAQVTGFEPLKIKIITPYIGGGFGRRLRNEYVNEAVYLSKAVEKPVKVVWTREDDVRQGAYRPMAAAVCKGGLDQNGRVTAFKVTLASPDRFGPSEAIYDFANIEIGMHKPAFPVPTGAWRSIHHSYIVYFYESFMDELASLAGEDPVEFRLKHLPEDSLYHRVTEEVARISDWGSELPEGHARGIAVSEVLAGTYVAQVVEVSIENGKPKVHKVHCAIDCGIAVSPGNVLNQAEGSIIWGLTAALYSKIDVVDGAIRQSNFHDYPALRMDETPEIEISILPSERDPGGMGEPAVPPVAPALTNALFALTGRRIRSLPIDLG